jgi:thiosulfate dehydrogenase
MTMNKIVTWRGGLLLVAVSAILFASPSGDVQAHKEKHTPQQLKAFHDVFMEQVRLGDLLFHGDDATAKQMGVNLSKTGMACAMCHPFASDTHPHEFPKFQEQIQEFATLRDMINWCIENPNEGERVDVNGPAMKALEAYHYWSNKGSVLEPGKH